MTEKTEWTADKLVALIKNKYPSESNGYNKSVVMEQVADGVGWEQERWVDAVVFQMWKSHGLTRSAFEVKISRHDFLQELAHPEKHQWVRDSMHEFWIVAPKDILQLEELPLNCGFMYPRGEILCIGRNAVRNVNPKLDDVLLASFMRSAWKTIEGVKKNAKRDALASSPEYIRAKMFEDAVQDFLNDRRGNLLFGTKDKAEIITCLKEATMDGELKKERDHLLEMMEKFRNHLLDASGTYLAITANALLEKDEFKSYLMKSWGGDDKVALRNVGLKAKRSDEEIDRDDLEEQIKKRYAN